MKCGLVIAVVLAGRGVAQADLPAGLVKAPAGWSQTAEPPRIESQATASVRSAFRPAQPGAILYVTRTEVKATEAQRNVIASAELAELEAAARRQGNAVQVEQQTKRADPGRQQLEGVLHWRDADAFLIDHSRALVAATAASVVAVTGQCVLALDAPPALVSACDAALATLEVDIAGEVRVALAIVGGGEPITTAPPEADAAPRPTGPAGGAAASTGAPQLRDAGRTPMAPILVKQDPAGPDRRPIYAGLGLIVFAALFYWNRRRRERFETDTDRKGAADDR